MPEYTQEQVEQAKKAIRYADRLGACHVTLHDAEVILSALEAAEQERDAQYRKNLELIETYAKLLGEKDKEILRLAHEATTEEVRAEEMQHARDLEYDRAEAAEARVKELEEAGDGMRGACPLQDARALWDALRKPLQ